MALITIAFTIAVVGAAAVDAPLATAIRDSGSATFLETHRDLKFLVKLPGFFGTTVVIAAIVLFVHPLRGRAAAFLLIAGMTSGVQQLLKLAVGRYRPFKPPDGSQRLAPFDLHPFHGGSNLCFPSGHACLAFATAAALSMLWPRWRCAFYVIALIVAAERVLENAHWLSDVVAAAGIGIGGAYLVRAYLGSRLLRNDSSCASRAIAG